MPKFSKHSNDILVDCDIRLQNIFNEVIKNVDCRAISGFRDKDEQNALYHSGKSQVKYPDSYHNSFPSKGIDIVPYPVDWSDRERFTLFAGYVLGVAQSMGYRITWGGDWDHDFLVKDNNFDDLAHFQIED